MAAILDSYLADKAEKADIGRMAFAKARLLPDMGHLRPDQITRETCRRYTERRRKVGVSNGTIIKELTVLRAALRWQDKATPAEFEFPTTPPPRERHLTRAEYAQLLDAAASAHIRLFIILALSTAGRASAILDLTWDRVDFQRGRILLAHHDQRSKKGRATVPMTKAARAALAEARESATTDHVIEYAGNRVASIKKAFERTAKRAKLPGVSPHVLRHTAAVWMVEAGTPIGEVAQFLGHTSEKVTFAVYARYSPEHLQGAASALEI